MTVISVTAREDLETWLTALEMSTMNFHAQLFTFEKSFFFPGEVDPITRVQKCRPQLYSKFKLEHEKSCVFYIGLIRMLPEKSLFGFYQLPL